MSINPKGRSPFLIVGDHAGNAVPSTLGTLGLSETELERHIAWDIGVQKTGEFLSAELDAHFLAQRYSRLVIDCNRAPSSAGAMPVSSDGTEILGNRGNTQSELELRIAAIHDPYHLAISQEISRRQRDDRGTIFLALHSFTPRLQGSDRPWLLGILHGEGDPQFAQELLLALRKFEGLTVGDNQPYRMDATDYTVPFHCFLRRIPYAEVEIRQDLISEAAGQFAWAKKLAAAVETAASQMWRHAPAPKRRRKGT